MTSLNQETALFIIDVQVGMFHESNPVFEGQLLLERLAVLIARARAANVSIIYNQFNAPKGRLLETGTANWQIHPAVAPLIGDLIIQKHTPDPFYLTNLQAELEARAIRKVIITGIQSEACVDTACRRAFGSGYEVILIKDGHSTMNSNHLSATQIMEHHNEVLRWFAEVKNAIDIKFD